MINCKNCCLYKQSRVELEYGNFTTGIGNREAKVMLIFDSIFRSDITSGNFFSDVNYKKLLNTFLKTIDLSLDEIYITSLLKCYLSDPKKKPTKVSVQKCFETHLQTEIELVQPRIVLLCGKRVSKFFIPEIVSMKQAVGRYFYSNIYKCYCLPVFDLYYLSRLSDFAPQYKNTRRAFGRVKYLLNKKKVQQEVTISSDYSKLKDLDKIASIDLETSGLDYMNDKILTSSISDLKQNIVFDLKEIKWKKIMAEAKKRKLIAHQANFEIKFFKSIGIDIEDYIIGDTKLMQFLINPLGALSLGFLTQFYFGYSYKDVIDRSKMEDMLPKDRKQYCGTDTYYTIRLFWLLLKKIKAQGSFTAFKVLMRVLRIFANMEYTGILIDRDKLAELMVYYSDEREKYAKKFKKTFKLSEDFNLNSYKQLQELLFDKLNFPVVMKTKKKKPSTAEKAIEILARKKPALKNLVEYRHQKGLIEKLTLYNNSIKKDGRIHTEFNLFSTGSSRAMSAKPNIQNPNREGRLKEIFITPEGYTFVFYDYKGLEFRVWVALSKDPKGIEFILKGKDIHRFIASRFWNKVEKEITNEQRNYIKRVVYGSIYGSSPEAIAFEYDVPLEEAKQIQRILFNICRKGYFWTKSFENKIIREKKVRTPFGTYKFFPDIEMAFKNKKEEMIRSGKNFMVQSPAAEFVYVGMHKVYKALQEKKLDTKYVHYLYDGLLLETPDNQIKETIEVVKEYAVSPVKIGVPLDVEIKVGKSWANLKKIE